MVVAKLTSNIHKLRAVTTQDLLHHTTLHLRLKAQNCYQGLYTSKYLFSMHSWVAITIICTNSLQLQYVTCVFK